MDLIKFKKLMMLTQSNNDGEALNALRAANRQLKAHGLNWEEFLHGKTPKAQNKPYGEKSRESQEIEMMLDTVLERTYGSSREFILSLNEQFRMRGWLSPKQVAALRGFYKKCKGL